LLKVILTVNYLYCTNNPSPIRLSSPPTPSRLPRFRKREGKYTKREVKNKRNKKIKKVGSKKEEEDGKRKKEGKGGKERRKRKPEIEKEKRRKKICPPLRANLLPAKLTHPPSCLPRKTKNGLPPYGCTQRRNTVPHDPVPLTLPRPLLEKLSALLLSQPNLENLLTYPPLTAYPLHPRPPFPAESWEGDLLGPPKPLHPSCLPC
jgi:hypothetical protein